ncbi:BatA domain-containing protein [Flagellimonas allohymeniacidonis]|uniref:Aerotolerance regulator N-terminal domain-containing protein n=1 Tax=Flagellimonas allohymeniacidonis TaxID=2517819 RepID=A0A4Q8QHD0_9FLAO|nr:BatA domain-containing protein [Allomuricauda hymeniacidonis]TAI48688.1 hypothetical protein EW142_02490 [Allomuricauda hymeniacidonis]
MQFKHPEILWALALLIIPILIHFFQLRRFKKTPFTNVAMLQKVTMESRKSNTLKKWLLLVTRCLLVAALVFAFAQPFTAQESALLQKETVVYLDDSFSMQAKSNGLSLFEKSVQDLIKYSDEEQVFSLFTNTLTFTDVTIKDIQNRLLELPNTPRQLSLEDIQLKAETLFSDSPSSEKNLIVLSDFQNTLGDAEFEQGKNFNFHGVQMTPKTTANVSIDSVYLENNNSQQERLKVYVSGISEAEAIPLSLYNGDTLIAKSAITFGESSNTEVEFSIPGNEAIDGLLQITDNSLSYDNQFFFNIDERPKIRVLAVSEDEGDYLKRLFTEDEFALSIYTLDQLDYSLLDNQNVVILDDLVNIPEGLNRILISFKEAGGTLIVIPSAQGDFSMYNPLVSNFFGTFFLEQVPVETRISKISFDHPIYRNVFENRVDNFQFPHAKSHFRVQSRAPNIISFEGDDAFLLGDDGFYLFTSSLERSVSNFKNSPLIVPTFYNMALSGLQVPQLYQTLGTTSFIDVPVQLGNDDVLNVGHETMQFIPLQKSFSNKVRLYFDEEPKISGIFEIKTESEVLSKISFNYPRTESKLSYLDIDNINAMESKDSMASLFQYLDEKSSVASYWKWFVIFALLLALIEVIIQKFVT